MDLVLEAVAPDLERNRLALGRFKGIPIDVLDLADPARDHGGEVQLLRGGRPVVGLIVGLGENRIVHDHDQADAGDPLRRGDSDLTRAQRGEGVDFEPRPQLRCRPPPAIGPRFGLGRFDCLHFEHFSPQSGLLAEQAKGPVEIRLSGDRYLDRPAPRDGDRFDTHHHRIRSLRLTLEAADPAQAAIKSIQKQAESGLMD